MLTVQHYAGFLATIAMTMAVGLYSMRYVKTASDFSVGGRKLTSTLVTGYLVGAFVGGTSTVGTTQIAYQLGISGIWFTLGAGLGCFLMGSLLVKPMRNANVETIPQYLGNHYGDQVVTWSSIYTTIGMFIQIIAQVLAAIPLLTTILHISAIHSAILTVAIIIVYILFGGFWGTSVVGIFKTILICVSLGLAGVISLGLSGGVNGLMESLPGFPWFSLFPNGLTKELAAVFSVVVGFISTQTYMQAVFAGKDVRSSRYGVYWSGIMITLIGLVCVVIGMFMQINYPDINGSLALPLFIINHLPPWFGGVVLAGLIISLVMTGASLTLGICTMLTQDIYKKMFRPLAEDKELIAVSRLLILLTASGSLLVVISNLNSLILEWAFLSMALRGVTVFLPLLATIFYPGKVHPSAGLMAIALAPMLAISWPLWGPWDIDPLYIGISISLVCLIMGTKVKRTANQKLIKQQK